MDSKKDILKFKGRVIEASRGFFRVELENGKIILAYPSGSMKKNYIKIGVGDTVEVEISPYDLTKGRIVWRYSEQTKKED
ncbi:Translation initiation factor IF-1 [bacterium HR19]|jgi:translation initiation factor IF-1|nr:Translation initiation factor IF-1 [bacterium HR19]